MLAPQGEQEGAERFYPREGHGRGEDSGDATSKNPPAYGERNAGTVICATGEISPGRGAQTAEGVV